MNFRDLFLKKAYSSDSDNLLEDFYIPVLSKAVEYHRLAGFFSSKSLAIASKGVLGLIQNGGIIKMIVSPKLSKSDIDVIVTSQNEPERFLEQGMLKELDDLEDEFIRDHVFALGWMVANQKLEIRVALVLSNNGKILNYEEAQQSALFHQKVGILKDLEGNVVTFSGSINETAAAWVDNIEEFKVFRSWEPAEQGFLENDILKFDKYWNAKSPRLKIIAIPNAIEKRLIQLAPQNLDELNLAKWHSGNIGKPKRLIKLFDHQKTAIEKWMEKGKQGILEMATGTGKTFTALGCLSKVLEDENKLLTVISAPLKHLVDQWYEEIEAYGLEVGKITARGQKWKDKLMDKIYDMRLGSLDKLIILATHTTLASEDFISIIKKSNSPSLLICDEVHAVGSQELSKGLLDNFYQYRLGLSATPSRWFDDFGTDLIMSYFGGTVFEFPLAKALHTKNEGTGKSFLCKYEYRPRFVELTSLEMDEYEKATEKISKSYHMAKTRQEKDSIFSLLCIKRQKIVVNAENKLRALNDIIAEIDEIKDCLVFCSDKQIRHVQEILMQHNIRQHKFTNEEDTTPSDQYEGLSERHFLLREFEKGNYQALVAIKCLDEGVDIPSAQTAIILASSGNPREYIQRRGRVLRPHPSKERAIIYDVLVIPRIEDLSNSNLTQIEKRIIEKEFVRYEEFAELAINSITCLEQIYEVRRQMWT